VQKLAENQIVASSRHDGLRISFHVYNTRDDVDAVTEILKKNIDLMVLAPAVASHD
jgi:selenocysteine lyase/cysteine desulfurase